LIELDRWKKLGHLWERSTGGSDVAARPSPDAVGGDWPAAPRAAGVDAATAWFTEGLRNSELPRFLFLIGGPGAGKSHAAAQVVEGLRPLDSINPLAQRTYKYQSATRQLVVVNDATIQSEQFLSAPLAREIDDAVTSESLFLACVNRGILVEEMVQLQRDLGDNTDTAGFALVSWLHSPFDQDSIQSHDQTWTVKQVGPETPFLKQGELLAAEGIVAEIIVVYVDVNSLYEPLPMVSITPGEFADIQSSPYKVTKFQDRMASDCESSPAGTLFKAAISALTSSSSVGEGFPDDPFSANVDSMTNNLIRRGILSVLRASEIVSGQRMTFREIWGSFSRCVIGGVHLELTPDELREFVGSHQADEGESPRQQFERMKGLAQYRFSEALFGSSSESGEIARDPILRLTRLVDPAVDAIPGNVNDASDNFGWASPITDAFSGGAGTHSPLSSLLHLTEEYSGFHQAVTDFDHRLDSAYVGALSPASDLTERERNAATAWYGTYLTRLFALSHGIPAYRREVSVWTLAWAMAPNIPNALEEQIKTLLKPIRNPERGTGVPLFPVFDSRTNPIQGDVARPRIAIRSDDVAIQTKTLADSLFVSVKENGRPDVSMLLDFAMVREAMACADGFAGATELSEATSPRLERFRAARLVPGDQMDSSNYRLVDGASDFPITVGAGQ